MFKPNRVIVDPTSPVLQQRVRHVPGDPEVIHWNARAATVRCFVVSVNEKPWLRDPLAGLKNFRAALNDFHRGDRVRE